MAEMKVKGILLKGLREFVLENFGEEGFNKLQEVLSEGSRKLLKAPLMDAASYDGNLFLEINRKICETFGEGKPEFARKLGAFSARKSVRGAFKFILKLASIPWALRRGETIYKMYYPNMGKLKIIKIDEEKSEGIISIEDVPFKDPYFEERIAGWIEEMGKILGSKKAFIEIKKSVFKGDNKIEYFIIW
ncbi:MAG: hypothetical protein ABIN20_01060 [candidate division WOR-3 bacterium]